MVLAPRPRTVSRARAVAAAALLLAGVHPAFGQSADTTWPPTSGIPGAIPDAAVGAIQTPDSFRQAQFTVSGMPGTVSQVTLELRIDHPAVGELSVELMAPDGVSYELVKWAGATDTSSPGAVTAWSSANAVVLSDAAPTTFWSAAVAATGGTLPAGSYRTGRPGGACSPCDVATSFDAMFEGREPNGLWRLYVRDGTNVTTPARTGQLQDARLRLITRVLPTATAFNDEYTAVPHQLMVVNAPGLMANDTTPPNTPRRQAELVAAPPRGSVTVNPDGSFGYLGSAVGADSFLYRVRTAGGFSNTAVVTISVVPSAPVVQDDAYDTAFATAIVRAAPGLLANDTSDAPLTASVATPPAHGTLALSPDGGFTYSPNPTFAGQDVFTYAASNAGGSRQGTVRITVAPPVSPVANADAYSTALDAAIAVQAPGVLDNDVSQATLAAAVVAAPSNGALALAADGSFTYTPNPGFSGTDTFTYSATGGGVASTPATVTIRVASAGAVAAPANLRVAWVAGNQVRLRWDAPFGPAPSGFVMEGGVSPGQTMASLPVPHGATAFDFVAPNGSFFVRVHALGANGRSAASNEVPLHVNVPVPPSAPDRLLAAVSGNALLLSWRNTFGGGASTGMMLDFAGTFNGSLPLPPGERFDLAGVPSGTFTFRVRQTNAAGVSGPSTPVTVTLPATCTGVPAPPTNVLAYRVGNLLTLTWDPPAAGLAAASYVIRASGAVNLTYPIVARMLTVPVAPGTYTIQVASANGCGQGPYSATSTVTVP